MRIRKKNRTSGKKWKDPFSFSILVLFVIIVSSFACTDISNISESEFSNYNAHYAIPLISDRLSLESLIENNVDNTSFRGQICT